MLILISKEGARQVLSAIRDGSFGSASEHWDLDLKRWLSKLGADAKASYVFPPIGNYTTHPSGCDPSFASGAGRPNCWGDEWCCEGTRRSEDRQRREKWLCTWTKKGRCEYLQRLLDEPTAADSRWRTFWCRQEPRPTDRTSRRLSEGGQRADAAGAQPLPTSKAPALARARAAAKAKAQAEATAAAAQRSRSPEPTASAASSSQPPPAPAAAGTLSQRQRRAGRQQSLMMSFRNWTEEPHEAAAHS